MHEPSPCALGQSEVKRGRVRVNRSLPPPGLGTQQHAEHVGAHFATDPLRLDLTVQLPEDLIGD